MIVTPRKDRSNRRFAFMVAAGAAVLVAGGALPLWRSVGTALGPALGAVAGVLGTSFAAFVAHSVVRRTTRRRLRVQSRPFPARWDAYLAARVLFYAGLSEEEKERFRRMLLVFLDEVRITGIRTDVDDATRLLVAASAIVPIFGFPDWEYERLGEVLIYPDSFDREYRSEGPSERGILGLVGTEHLSGVMILSKPDLEHGFSNPNDKRNVGIHEFAHLVDRGDGSIDGVPPGLRAAVRPWIGEVHEMLAHRAKADDIDPYAFTNEAEFFAVLAEYFFEAPDVLERRHPRIYRSLQALFRQDPRARIGKARRALSGFRKRKVGRNQPCPCGSGKKYKRCCLARGRRRSGSTAIPT